MQLARWHERNGIKYGTTHGAEYLIPKISLGCGDVVWGDLLLLPLVNERLLVVMQWLVGGLC